MMKWVFLRHGQSEANAQGWLSGHVDTPLTTRGEEQAREAKQRCLVWNFDRVFCSDLLRAHRTAELAIAGRDLELVVTPRLRERHMGDWACERLAELRAAGKTDVLVGWDGQPPNGESLSQLAARVLPYLSEIELEGSTTLVVAHGALIRMVLGLVDGLEYADIGPKKIANCEPHFRELPAGFFGALIQRHESSLGLPRSG